MPGIRSWKSFGKFRFPASKVDVWRYCILYREGGVYCDIDSALAIPLRELLKDDPSEVISFENNKWRDVLSPGAYADPKIFCSDPPPEAAQNFGSSRPSRASVAPLL